MNIDQYNSGNVEINPGPDDWGLIAVDGNAQIPETNIPVPKTSGAQDFKETVYGFVRDIKGAPIAGATIQMYWLDNSGDPGDITALPDSAAYTALTDYPDRVGIKFSAHGYSSIKIPWSQLVINPDATLKKSFPLWAILAVLAAVALYRKQTKRVGKLDSGSVMAIGLLVAGLMGFSLVKEILEWLGLWKSKDTKDLDNASTNPESFWNPNYWQTIKPSNKNWTYAITDTQAAQMCTAINDAFGPFNDDEEAVIGIFKSLRTKANCSFLCYIFQQVYGQDLLTWLRGGWWPQDRLSDSDVNTINQYINNLPNY